MVELPHGHAARSCYLADRRRMVSLSEKYSTGPLHDLPMLTFNQGDILSRNRNQMIGKNLTFICSR